MYFHHVLVKVVQGVSFGRCLFNTFIYLLCPSYRYSWETKRATKGWYQLFQSFSAAYTQQLFTFCSNDC
ncbi:hypothetical protein CsSME_00011567 [Camellia sinensis var. sinensis]